MLARFLPGACLTAALTLPSFAFNGHFVTEGPLALRIGEIPVVRTLDEPQTVPVFLTNSSAAALTVNLEMTGLVDECRASGPPRAALELPPRGHGAVQFAFRCGSGTHSALYPVHVRAAFTHEGRPLTAHAIQIFQTEFPPAPVPVPDTPLEVPSLGSLALASLKAHRVTWQRFGEPPHEMPAGWEGHDEGSGTWLGRGWVARGGNRYALQTHPPYRGGAGTLFVEYRLRLPDSRPLSLDFFNAIRDHSENEPPSDGVTFRVWVGDSLVFERHTDSKTWVPGHADLSPWAGREIRLRLESHPGPKNNTVCDSGFWGDPAVIAGSPPRALAPEERREQAARAVRALTSESGTLPGDTFRFELQAGQAAALVLGPNGVADASLALGSADKSVVFDGFIISLEDRRLASGPAGLYVRKFEAVRDPGGRLTVRHHVPALAGEREVRVEVWAEQAGLRLKIASDGRLTDLAPGNASRTASRLYYGHGYCVVEPQAFRAGGGGHNLASSHIGLEFDPAPGSSFGLLIACDTPPDHFEVEPASRTYALHTHPDTTFTFVPSARGAFDAALKFRPLSEKRPAPALARKAGRFVFDIWGGRYADNTRLLRRCFAYGLTNSLALIHVWQRWGYDYRLPDIFPPLPELGTLEDLRELGRVCDQAGALWGLHDNYIDIYPDATGFSYEHVTFDAQGRPRKAWLNEGRNAQSYQFRPDRVRPFLQRNLDLIQPALRPTASFVDVWTSINAFDFYDRQGTFHSKTETLRCWGEAFALIRDTLGHAPTTSEAGSDQLIGWLEGADCQLIPIGTGPHFNNRVPCRDWERVPWLDAVHHARFSLHGVGYSDRYQGGRSRDDHGIESDDYLSAEVLTGHALMMDRAGLVRGAVRKYWLAQDFIERIARDDLAAVRFEEGDIHRVAVEWSSGARVWVNRGARDWAVAGRVLPPFGYFASAGPVQSSVERLDDRVVEQSRAPGRLYVNARGFNPNLPLPILPEAEGVEYLGGRNFRLRVVWHSQRPAPKDLAVFYHFSRAVPGRYTNFEFVGGGFPEPPTSQWPGRQVTGTDWTVVIPEAALPGDYEVLVGLYDARGDGRRFRLLGDETAGRRYRLGVLKVEGSVADGRTHITSVRLEKTAAPGLPTRALQENRSPAGFGAVTTLGALQVRRCEGGLLLLPLPDAEEDFAVTLNLPNLVQDPSVGLVAAASRPSPASPPKSLHVIQADGATGEPVPFQQEAGKLTFTVRKNDFGYRLEW